MEVLVASVMLGARVVSGTPKTLGVPVMPGRPVLPGVLMPGTSAEWTWSSYAVHSPRAHGLHVW